MAGPGLDQHEAVDRTVDLVLTPDEREATGGDVERLLERPMQVWDRSGAEVPGVLDDLERPARRLLRSDEPHVEATERRHLRPPLHHWQLTLGRSRRDP